MEMHLNLALEILGSILSSRLLLSPFSMAFSDYYNLDIWYVDINGIKKIHGPAGKDVGSIKIGIKLVKIRSTILKTLYNIPRHLTLIMVSGDLQMTWQLNKLLLSSKECTG